MSKNYHAQTRRGFTLAELLIVIVILGVMLTVALPPVFKMASPSKLEAAATAVHSAARMARQHALAHGQPTYLIFNEGQIDESLAYRAYAVFTINIHTNLPPGAILPSDAGQFLTNWELLPVGILFNPIAESSSDENVFLGTETDWEGGFNAFNLLHIDGHDYTVAGFTPKGRSGTDDESEHHIFLAEGLLVNDTDFTVSERQGKQIQFNALGQSQVNDVFFDQDGSLQEMPNG